MSGEVRLVHTTGGIYMPTFGEVAITHIALPAAEFEAWGRVVEAARRTVSVLNVGEGHRIDWQDREVLRELASAIRAMPYQQPGRAGGGA